ncbi:conserved hypothetical protein [Metallosphaera cuprina Ar-4]|uniref:Uncharacterized protein n=2 Tax=Metallosphaera TaxID=41980 RepID=F4G3B8_METCR|nr:conserved hypothetical protein [Metallosphaera cuprina Ar-4]
MTIAILTDFGTSDNYNGVMEAVIKKLNREADIIYISPEAKNFNIISGSYLLYTSFRYFRKNTIFLVVIDPGVGTERKPLAIKTRNYIFIGPDNGVLYPSIKADEVVDLHVIDNEKVYLSKAISNTFHGRDIFSISAALLSLRVPMDTLGSKISEDRIQKVDFSVRVENNMICTKVIFIDHYGNVALALRDAKVKLGMTAQLKVGGRTYQAWTASTFQDRETGLIVYRNGYGFLELGLNKANASLLLDVKEGDDVCIEGSILVDFSPFI